MTSGANPYSYGRFDPVTIQCNTISMYDPTHDNSSQANHHGILNPMNIRPNPIRLDDPTPWQFAPTLFVWTVIPYANSTQLWVLTVRPNPVNMDCSIQPFYFGLFDTMIVRPSPIYYHGQFDHKTIRPKHITFYFSTSNTVWCTIQTHGDSTSES